MALTDKLTAIGDAIREKNGSTEKIPLADMPQVIRDMQSGKEEQEKTVNITENGTTEVLPDEDKVLSKVTVNVEVQGGTEEIEQLIDESGVLEDTEGSVSEKVEELIDYANFKNIIQNFINQSNGTGTGKTVYVFKNSNVKDVSMFDFSQAVRLDSLLQDCQEIEEVEIDASSAVYMNLMCSGCTKLKKVIVKNMSDECTDVRGVFAYCTSLEIVEGLLDFSSIKSFWSNWDQLPFRSCNLLKEIRVVENCIKVNFNVTSPLLSAESIQSIAYGLAYVTTAQTLTLNKVFENDFEKLPAELRDLITNQKGWTLGFA